MAQSRHQPNVPPINQSPGIRAQVPHQFLSPQVLILLRIFCNQSSLQLYLTSNSETGSMWVDCVKQCGLSGESSLLFILLLSNQLKTELLQLGNLFNILPCQFNILAKNTISVDPPITISLCYVGWYIHSLAWSDLSSIAYFIDLYLCHELSGIVYKCLIHSL